MKKLISVIAILAAVFALMVPAFASAAVNPGQEMWVNCDNGLRLNLRTGPGTNCSLITRLDNGKKVEILEALDGGWVKVTDGKVTGFVMSKFLWERKPGKYEITEREDTFVQVAPYTVSAKALNAKTVSSVGLRVKPNKTSRAIRRLEAGDELQVVARGKVWSKVVDLRTGKTGYAANDYLMLV